jgi:hypothetical protein
MSKGAESNFRHLVSLSMLGIASGEGMLMRLHTLRAFRCLTDADKLKIRIQNACISVR